MSNKNGNLIESIKIGMKMKCKYESDFEGGLNCGLDAIKDGLCIIHSDFPKDKNELDKVVKEKIDRDDYNFEGANLYNFDFPDKKTKNMVIFRKARLKGNVILSSKYNDAEFGGVNFFGAVIAGDVQFGASKIRGNVTFAGDSKVSGNVEFGSTKIEGESNFSFIEIGKDLVFSHSELNEVNFWGAKIEKNARFRNITINNDAVFTDMKVGGNLFFDKTEPNQIGQSDKLFVGGNAKFERIKIEGNSYFNEAVFNEEVNFTDSKFFENVHFSETVFKKFANFKEVSILSNGIFNELIGFNASFESSRLKNVSFRNCDLTNVSFLHAIFENCKFSTSKWNDIIPEHKNYEKCKKDSLMNPDTVAGIYRNLRQSLQQEGAYAEAGKMYVREMNMKKEFYKKNNRQLWVLYVILSFISEYGENSKRLLLLLAIYYLIFVWFIFNYGAIDPEPNWFRIINVIMTGLGGLLLSLFVYVFARKMSR